MCAARCQNRRGRGAILWALTCLAASRAAAVPAEYTVTDLGTWGTYWSYCAAAINDLGQVVGYQDGGTSGPDQAVLWLPAPALGLPAGLHVLGALTPGAESQALDINNVGQIVGWSETGETGQAGPIVHPFLWENGVMTDLGTPPGAGDTTAAAAVNDLGQVAGYTVMGWVAELLLWLPEPAFGLPVGWTNLSRQTLPYRYSHASDINALGQIVGHQSQDYWPYAYGKIWLPVPAYGLPAGIQSIYPMSLTRAINDVGQVVGEAGTAPGQASRAHLWQNGTATDLGTLGGQWSEASGVNDEGVIVGWAYDAAESERACRWVDGQIEDLNDLIIPRWAWVLKEAVDINESGQILAEGTQGGATHVLLLSPVVCGDGNTEGSEECDDGNTMPGDGCDEDCQIEIPIPAASAWGVVAMTLLLLAAGSIVIRRSLAVAVR